MFKRIAFLSIPCLVASLATCFAQTPTAAATAGNVAYVYVGTGKGVYLYNAAANGSLTAVSATPYSISGLAISSNGKYFISLGTDYVHSYSIASNGAIQKQASQINAQTYFSEPNSDCGTNANAVLDHTGKDIYLQLGLNGCTAMQSYQVSSAGALSFLDSSSYDGGIVDPYVAAPAIIGNDIYGYNSVNQGSCGGYIINVFQRQSSGAFAWVGSAGASNPPDITINYPSAPSGWGFAVLPTLTVDPSDHLALAMQQNEATGGCGAPVKPVQLASYTLDSHGDLSTTNVAASMPTPNVYPTVMNMSPSGQYLAVGGDPQAQNTGNTAPQTAGLQVFHFNGASSITTDSGTLTTAPIDEIHWDNSNHLYALSNSTGKLYAYTVTSSGVTAIPGSPYSFSKPDALVIVPTVTSASCATPTSDGVNICSPTSGSTGSSPVQVEASAKVTGTISSTQLWIDGVKKDSVASTTLNTSIAVAAGSHRFAVIAINTAGQKWETAVNATVN